MNGPIPSQGATAGAGSVPIADSRVLAAALVFTTLCAVLAFHQPSLDLFPLYAAGRLAAEGSMAQVYVFEPASGIEVTTPAWLSVAAEAGHSGEVFPFVYPPLWAKALAPLASGLDWTGFRLLFSVLAATAAAAAIALATTMWAAPERRSEAAALALLISPLGWPVFVLFVYNQVHGLLLLAVLLSWRAADRGRPARAGLLLALAASLKLAPAAFGLYFLLSRQWAAAAWSLAFGAGLLGISLLWAGLDVNLAYFEQCARLAAGIPTTLMNQSFTLAFAELLGDMPEALGAAPPPPEARALALGVAATLIAAAAMRHGGRPAAERRLRLQPVLLFALQGAAPMCWLYYFMLLPALALCLPGRIARGGWIAAAVIAPSAALSVSSLLGQSQNVLAPFLTTGQVLLVCAALVWAPDARPALRGRTAEVSGAESA